MSKNPPIFKITKTIRNSAETKRSDTSRINREIKQSSPPNISKIFDEKDIACPETSSISLVFIVFGLLWLHSSVYDLFFG